ncbi:HTH_Tnp_Tc3_2 domain-containing protein [Trichonephila clavipes]|nr:HTH_Tnp_Tc3_2 domain-containing protein [Trichonephila clavipes]
MFRDESRFSLQSDSRRSLIWRAPGTRYHQENTIESHHVTRMDCPAYLPDLNPIEHLWDMLGRRIAARKHPPTCLPEIRRALLDVWCNIPNVLECHPAGTVFDKKKQQEPRLQNSITQCDEI